MTVEVIAERERKTAEALALMEKAKLHVQCYHTFYGALLSKLKLKPDWRHQTMYTDAVVLGFNPEFTLMLPWDAILYIDIHEVTHCGLGHPFRRGNRNPRVWNEAIDHVTNLTLNRDPELNRMFQSMKGTAYAGLADVRFTGMHAEQVYDILWAERLAARKQLQELMQKQKMKPQPGNTVPQMSDDANECASGESSQPSNTNTDGGEPDDDAPLQPGTSGTEQDAEPPNENEPPKPPDEDEEHELSGASGMAGDCLDAGASGEPLHDEDAEDDDEKDGKTASDDGDDGDGDIDDDDYDDDAPTDDAEGEIRIQDDDGNVTSLSPADIEELKREWEEALMTAELAAGGDVPEAMRRALGTGRECKKSFREYTDEFLEKCALTDITWNRPARRFKDYLPSYTEPGMKTLIGGVDTSGSVSDDALATMEVALQRIMDEFMPKELILIYCDSRVRGMDRFLQGEEVSLRNAKGGGGTRFHPVFRQVLELEMQGEEIAGVIYLTDLQGSLQDAEDFEHLHVLWVVEKQRHVGPAPGGLGTVVCLKD